jgi:tetratricopeptide (TPR) repeat protein
MSGEEQHSQPIEALAESFEKMLSSDKQLYYDTDQLEDIIEHYLLTWQFPKASRAISYAKQLYPFDHRFDLYLAKTKAHSGRAAEALNLIMDLERLSATDDDLLLLKGEVLYVLKRYEESLQCYRALLDRGYDEMEVRLSMSNVFMDQGKYQEAMMALEDAFPEMRHEEYVYDLLDTCFIETNSVEKGILFYNRLIDEFPYTFLAWKHLGELYRERTLYEKAVWALGFCEAIREGDAQVMYLMAESLYDLSKFDESLSKFMELIEMEPENPVFYHCAGNCYEEMDKQDEARLHYRKALKINPKYPSAWYGVSCTYYNDENYKKARYYAEKAIELKPYDPDYLMHYASILVEIDEMEDAIETYKVVVENSPELPEAWLDYSLVLNEHRDREDAIELLFDALEHHEESAAIHYRIASYCFLQGRDQLATEHLILGLKLNPEDAFLLYLHAPFLNGVPSVDEIINLYTK